MFENKAFYVEMIDKRDRPDSPPRESKFQENFAYAVVVIAGGVASLIFTKAVGDIFVNLSRPR